MTIIAALKDPENKQVILGSDSDGSDSGQWTIAPLANKKIFVKTLKDKHSRKVCDFGIGCTSSYRMMQVLQYQWKLPTWKEAKKDIFDEELCFEWMVSQVAESIREVFKSHGFATVYNNTERGGEFLLCFAGHVFKM